MEKSLPKALFDNLTYMKDRKYYLNMAHVKNKKDYIHAHNFLWSYRGSVDTFNAYRREIERLLQWSWLIAKKPLQKITKNSFEKYLQFCKKPLKSWIGLYRVPRFVTLQGQRVPNQKWRPFVVTLPKKKFAKVKQVNKSQHKLSRQSLKEIFAINQSFYNYLVEQKAVSVNPIAQIRQKNKYLPRKIYKKTVRKLSDLQWSFVIETAEIMAQEYAEHERLLFIMNMLYSLYLRISELTVTYRSEPQMKDFYRDHGSGWWFRTIGKGNKERSIPVSDALLKALKRYRKTLDLPALPSPQEDIPLLPKQRGSGAITSTKTIRNMVQLCFNKAVERLEAEGFNEEAEALKSATVHWLRHTGISNDVKFRPREHVRDDAGHSSSAITDQYIDVELKERYFSAKNKRIKVD